jgi:UDP-GlcNAc:undecaprenyl-phosphate GlcNAc-1-phosphate transferase
MRFLLGLALGLALTPASMWAGNRAGLLDRPDATDLKIHTRPVPVSGGIAVVVAWLLTMALLGPWPPAVVVGCVTVALGLGTVDDFRSIPPWIRIAVTAAAGILLAIGIPTRIGSPVLDGLFAVALVLSTTNGANLIDGQDGLAGGVAVSAAMGLAAIGALHGGGAAGSAMMLALGGALVGFLVWNRPPARVFLGNGGAYAVGAALAVGAATAVARLRWSGLIGSALCLAPFAFELAFTMIHRASAGRGILVGDRLHSYDLLSSRLGSRPRATVVTVAVAVACSAVGVVAAASTLLVATSIAVGVAAIAGVLGLILWSNRTLSRTTA